VQGDEADAVAAQWDEIRISGGNISFTNDSDNASIPTYSDDEE